MKALRTAATLITVGVLVFTSCTSTNHSVTTETESIADSIAEQLLGQGDYSLNSNIAVLPLVDSVTGESDDFSIYFSDELITSLFRLSNGELTILERTQVSQLLKEAEFTASGLISEDTAVELGVMLGVDTVIIGTFKKIGDTLRINARSVSIQTGKISAVANADLSRTAYTTVLTGEPETVDPAAVEVDTIMPGVLTVGYTDLYVDGYLNQDDDGPHGLDSEIAKIIADSLNLEIEWVKVPTGEDYFTSIVASLNAYKVDMFISVTSIRPERGELVLFSIPYTTEGEDLGISFRKGNSALKAVVDPLLQKMIDNGTIANLKAEYVDPVKNIFETNNMMRAIEGKYFVESCIISGNEVPSSQLDSIEISYEKWWDEYPLEGRRSVRMKILDSGYGRFTGLVVEHRNSPELIGAKIIHKIDMQQLIETGRWQSEIKDMETGENLGSLFMVKVE